MRKHSSSKAYPIGPQRPLPKQPSCVLVRHDAVQNDPITDYWFAPPPSRKREKLQTCAIKRREPGVSLKSYPSLRVKPIAPKMCQQQLRRQHTFLGILTISAYQMKKAHIARVAGGIIGGLIFLLLYWLLFDVDNFLELVALSIGFVLVTWIGLCGFARFMPLLTEMMPTARAGFSNRVHKL